MAESSKDDNKSYILFYVLLFGLLLFGLILFCLLFQYRDRCLQRRQRRPQRDLEADRPLHGGRAGNIYLVPLPPAAIPAQCSCATKVMKLKELDDRFPAVKFRALKRNADGQPEVAHRATCDSSQGEMAMAANDKPELAPGSPHGVKAEPGLSEIQVVSQTGDAVNLCDCCAICLDALREENIVRKLTCDHMFHSACIDPWLTGRTARCPVCKADMA